MTEEEIFGPQGLNNSAKTTTGEKISGTPEEKLAVARRQNSESYSSTWGGRSEKEAKDDFNRLALQVERKGGNVYGQSPDIGAKMDKLVEKTEETNRILRQNQAQAPPPLLARPPMIPLRVPGAAAPRRP